ncbi:MAG: tRNA (guanosine(46)-N7)-methyltransferase TrmB [Actinobacteria bacterium]|uniref:tRNA (guanine(46)-N(7))-methyltransferase n=1 Tax=freshwater metagenome TaxID=449393 RepID=A0A6J7IXX9_9ZZZZ|nr:tRNA (guanosine(46)-N7)-methyltransferase TrmB [Actinomycetota bacterium]
MSIRTYKPRRGRVTPRQAAALGIPDGLLIELGRPGFSLEEEWAGRPVIMEIGFGTGAATAVMAGQQPDHGLLAIDVHTPGIGDLLHRIRSAGLTNVRVMEADALEVLRSMIAERSLAGVRTYFPDPWPKARHHKRRIVTVEHATLIGSRSAPHAIWDLATDWAPYAEQMIEVLGGHPMWEGGPVERPAERPITRFEQTALDQGRVIADLRYVRSPA